MMTPLPPAPTKPMIPPHEEHGQKEHSILHRRHSKLRSYNIKGAAQQLPFIAMVTPMGFEPMNPP